MARGYNESVSVYDPRPYHAYCPSDYGEEDDDICMWKDGPELTDVYDSETEQLANSFTKLDTYIARGRSKAQVDGSALIELHGRAEDAGSANAPPSGPSAENSERLTDDQFRDRQTAYALSTARRNLTRMSQFILKLECRAGKVTKEGIRQTLDATVGDSAERLGWGSADSHLEEIEEIKFLTESAWQRLYLIDRHWRRQSRRTREAQGRSGDILLESDPDVRTWLREERQVNHSGKRDLSYFTVSDLAKGRKFEDWIVYLKETCGFKDHPIEETKLVHLAWRFLDRSLRGSRPGNPADLEDFVIELQDKHEGGAFDEALRSPKKQEQDDEQAWDAIKKYWFSRFQH